MKLVENIRAMKTAKHIFKKFATIIITKSLLNRTYRKPEYTKTKTVSEFLEKKNMPEAFSLHSLHICYLREFAI